MTDVLGTFRGVIGGQEIFVHTLAIRDANNQSLIATANDMRDTFKLAWDNAEVGMRTLFSDQVEYTEVTAAEILNHTSGALSAAQHVAFADPVPVGTGNAGNWTTAMAVSLTAGVRPNGTPLRGRFYLPTIASTNTSGGSYQQAVVEDLAGFVSEWLLGLEGRNLVPCVWSRKLGALQDWTETRIGDVPDTIRSRRNGINEVYYPVAMI